MVLAFSSDAIRTEHIAYIVERAWERIGSLRRNKFVFEDYHCKNYIYEIYQITLGISQQNMALVVMSNLKLSLSYWYPGSGGYLIVSIPDLCPLSYYNCSIENNRNLECIQIEAAHIITGATKL